MFPNGQSEASLFSPDQSEASLFSLDQSEANMITPDQSEASMITHRVQREVSAQPRLLQLPLAVKIQEHGDVNILDKRINKLLRT